MASPTMRRSTALLAMLAVCALARADEGFYAHLYEPDSLALSEIIGMELRSPEGRSLGKIQALLYDRKTRKVEEIAVEGATYPVTALAASDTPGVVVLELPTGASAGASAPTPRPDLEAASDREVVIGLRDGRLKSAR